MKGVVKRAPRERSSAGWNLWCYLFCDLIGRTESSQFIHSKGNICSLWGCFGFVGWGLGFFFHFPEGTTAGFLGSEFRILPLRKINRFQINGDLSALSLDQDQI